MKVKVVTEDGDIRTIDLQQPKSITHGKKLNTICLGDIDHWFTKSGYYDGEGACAIACDTCRTQRA